jgi:hypothetical protein
MPMVKWVLYPEFLQKLQVSKELLTWNIFQEYVKFLNRLYDITWFGAIYAY